MISDLMLTIIFFIGLLVFSVGVSIDGGTFMWVFGLGTMAYSIIVALFRKGAFS